LSPSLTSPLCPNIFSLGKASLKKLYLSIGADQVNPFSTQAFWQVTVGKSKENSQASREGKLEIKIILQPAWT
jgi:hypothetical protein